MNSDFSDFIRFFPIFRLFPTFRLLDSTTLIYTDIWHTMYVYDFCLWFCIYTFNIQYILDPDRQDFHKTWKLRMINWQIYRCCYLVHAHTQEQELWALWWASILQYYTNGNTWMVIVFLSLQTVLNTTICLIPVIN